MPVKVAKAHQLLIQADSDPLYLELIDIFSEAFPEDEEVEFVRAPGRVNIIGEHTDYNGLSVMPMAINREIGIALSPQQLSEVELVSAYRALPKISFKLSEEIEPYEIGHWGNYAKAAAQAICEWVLSNAPSKLPMKGFKGCLGGTIPSGAGLSSSSALVVAVAMALVVVNDLPIGKYELADILAKGERYVGTEGGGMDQAASLLSQKGAALKIDFFPLKAHPIKLPKNYAIVIANSMLKAKKTGGVRLAYNTRVAECKLALEMLKHDARANCPEVDNAVLLRDFAQLIPQWSDLMNKLPESNLSLTQIASYVEMSEDDLVSKCLVQRDGNILKQPEQGFSPKKRCRHVLTEGKRVEYAALASEQGDAIKLGELMNQSHTSCAEDYEISCPELDELVSILRRSGALGARLTGAGFGGCAIGLVNINDVDAVIDAVWSDYYCNYLHNTSLDRSKVLFACSPSDGAGLIKL